MLGLGRSYSDSKGRALFCLIVKVSEVELNSNSRLVLFYLEDAVLAVEYGRNGLACGIELLFFRTPVDAPGIGNGIAVIVNRVGGKLDVVVIEGVDIFHCDLP